MLPLPPIFLCACNDPIVNKKVRPLLRSTFATCSPPVRASVSVPRSSSSSDSSNNESTSLSGSLSGDALSTPTTAVLVTAAVCASVRVFVYEKCPTFAVYFFIFFL